MNDRSIEVSREDSGGDSSDEIHSSGELSKYQTSTNTQASKLAQLQLTQLHHPQTWKCPVHLLIPRKILPWMKTQTPLRIQLADFASIDSIAFPVTIIVSRGGAEIWISRIWPAYTEA